MKDALQKAKLELGRADHLVFVSLKYSRTVDVFRNALARMIAAYEYMIDALVKCIKKQVQEGKVSLQDLQSQESKDELKKQGSENNEANVKPVKTLKLPRLSLKNIEELSFLEKAEIVASFFEDEEFKKNIDLFLTLRKVLNASYQAINEYRRHVTMKVFVDNQDLDIDIDTISNFYLMEKKFLSKVEEVVENC
ncbi:hypothetical protein J7L02_00605 [Candidatus Woesearchaeota archaeon]|nr:hypothetical protein [Candidatus Woesearchaeota archaeon]